MKIIDEKGRLFGLINILDLVVLLGALIILYLGISIFLVLKTPALKLTGITPDRIEEGTSVPATAELINDRMIKSANLRLIPHNFPGETIQFTCQSSKITNKQLIFTFPPNLKPGEYEVELEIAVTDIFTRTSIHIDRLQGKYLTVEPKKVEVVEVVEVVEEPVEQKPVFDGRCLWEVDLSAVIPANQLKGLSSLEEGDTLRTSFPDIELTLAGIRQSTSAEIRALPAESRRAGARTASLSLKAGSPDLGLYLGNSAGQLTFYKAEEILGGFLTGGVSVTLDLIFYIAGNPQLAALKDEAREKSADGKVLAQVVAVFGEIDNPWFKSSESRSALTVQRAYQIARMKLACTIENGKLYYRNMPLEPNRLISFTLEGKRIEGSVLINSPDYVILKHNVLLTSLPQRLAPLLRPGIVISHPTSGAALGFVLEVLGRDSIEPESLMRPDVPPELGELFCRALVRLSLNCNYVNGFFNFNNQTLDYGKVINFRILGEVMSGTIYLENTLPLQGKPEWKAVEVEFSNVLPDIAALITPGDNELAGNGQVTKRILSIVSNDSAQTVLISAEGKYVRGRHPLNRDVRCRVELHVSRIGDSYYYQNAPLNLGTTLPFTAKRWSVNGRLVEF